MLIPSQGKELCSTIVSDSSMEPSGRSPNQDMLRELFTMDIKGFIPFKFQSLALPEVNGMRVPAF